MKPKFHSHLHLGIIVVGLAGAALLQTAQAASATWNNAISSSWQNSANWTATPFPGLTTNVYTSLEDATFSTTGASGQIDLGNQINLRSLIFGVSAGSAAAFTIGDANDTLNFTTAGGITINSGVTTAQNIGVAGTTINLSTAVAATTTYTNNGTGSLTVAGNIVANAASGSGSLTVGGSGNTTVSGTITKPGAGSFTLSKIGAGTLTLSGANTFIGDTLISNGKIALGNALALQNSAYDTTGSTGAIGLDSTGLTTPTFGGLKGSVNLAMAITAYSAISTLTLNPGTGVTHTYSGSIGNNAANNLGLTKTGAGTQTLSGANTYTGATTVNSGTLNLGGGTANGSLASTALNLGGGTLAYTRTGNTTQTFTTTVVSGVSAVSAVAGNVLDLGIVSRSAGGAIDFSSTGAGTVTALSGSNVGGIIPGATFGNNWAVANGAGVAISALGTYTLTSSAGTTAASYAGANIDVNNSAGAIAAVITPNSLRFNTVGAFTMTLATGNNDIGAGSILVTNTVGANASTITGGTLRGGVSGDLAIIQNNTAGNLTIASIIGNNTATSLTKSGAGVLTLSATSNTYTGFTTVSSGTLSLTAASANNIATSSGISIGNGATLDVTGLTTNVLVLTSGQTITGTGATGFIANGISGTDSIRTTGNNIISNNASGTLTLARLNVLGAGNAITGGTIVLNNALAGRGLLIGNGAAGTLTLSGGTIQSTSITGTDLIANNTTASLIINGGNYLNTSSGGTSLGNNNGTPTLTLTSGSATMLPLVLSAAAGTGATVNLDGGILTVTTINQNNANPGTFNFNGGTLKAGASSGTYWNLNAAMTANVRLNGAKIDDGGFAITVGQPLIHEIALGATADGGLTKSGTGTLTLTGPNTYTGITTVSAGNLNVGNITALGTTAGGTTVASGAAIVLANSITVTGETATIAGGGPISIGALTSANGASATWAGTVDLGTGGSGRLGADGGVLTVSGPIIGSGSVLQISSDTSSATGVVILSGTSNTYSGGTQIVRGTLKLGATNALPTATTLDVHFSPNTTNPATFNLNGNNQTIAALQNTGGTNAIVTVTNSSATPGTLTVSGSTSTTYSGVITGGSALALAKNGSGTLSLTGTNTYTGSTTINGGTLTASGGSAIADTSAVVLANTAGAIFNPTTSETIGSLAGGGAAGGNVTLGATTLTAGGNNTTTTFAGAISGTGGALAKTGSGTLLLTGNNTYTGATTINAGILAITGSINSSVTVDNLATLAGNGNIGGSVLIASGAHHALAVGATSGIQITRNITGALTLTSGNILDLSAVTTPATGSYTLVTATGGITGTPTTINYSGFTGTVAVVGNSLVLTVGGSGGYDSWKTTFGAGFDATNNGFSQDPDNDGVVNLMEYVLNGNPLISSGSILPTLDASGANFVFTFHRRNESKDDTVQVFQYNADLSAVWTGITIPATAVGTPVNIMADTPSAGIDQVTVTVPKGSNTSLFGRLEVSK